MKELCLGRHASCQKGREGKGYIAVPACGGSLAEAKRACNQTSCQSCQKLVASDADGKGGGTVLSTGATRPNWDAGMHHPSAFHAPAAVPVDLGQCHFAVGSLC
eukprot:scaffold210410_cov17-Tisochrysis_lutea.AAC.3